MFTLERTVSHPFPFFIFLGNGIPILVHRPTHIALVRSLTAYMQQMTKKLQNNDLYRYVLLQANRHHGAKDLNADTDPKVFFIFF